MPIRLEASVVQLLAEEAARRKGVTANSLAAEFVSEKILQLRTPRENKPESVDAKI